MPFGGLLTVGLISAGTSLVGAKMASGAAKGAAETQADYGREALALQRDIYNQNRADMQPWLRTGGEAVTTLGSLMGLGGGGYQAPGDTGGGGARFGTQAAGMTPGPMNASGTIPYLGKPLSPDSNPDVSLVQTPRGIAAARRTGSSYGGQVEDPGDWTTQTGSAYVQLRAPTGEVQQVPAAAVPFYLSRGATRV